MIVSKLLIFFISSFFTVVAPAKIKVSEFSKTVVSVGYD